MPKGSRFSYQEEVRMNYKFGNAIVRIYGECDQAKLKQATADFLKKAEQQRRNKKSNTPRNLQESNAS